MPVSVDALAEAYVRLVLALGQHDSDYVDAYYGPAEWRARAEQEALSLVAIEADADALGRQLAATTPPDDLEDRLTLRQHCLVAQVNALRARVAMLQGRTFSFDEESKALYDAVSPTHDEAEFLAVLDDLEALAPGSGALRTRLDAFRDRFQIPRDRLEATFGAAIDECRMRTRRHITLPPEESFRAEYVTCKPWTAYNWYQGGYRSLIQVNTDLPARVDAAIDLACHEGYPGHHVYNVLLERQLLRGLKWVEFSVYPLFSPQSLIAEGTANYGISLAFPGSERLEFERAVIFPTAGLNPDDADSYYAVLGLLERLSYAGNEAARRYREGRLTASDAADWLERYALMSRPRAEQRVRFIERYGSYVINYNLGQDMVADYMNVRLGGSTDPTRRWREFEKLLSAPRLPSDLRVH